MTDTVTTMSGGVTPCGSEVEINTLTFLTALSSCTEPNRQESLSTKAGTEQIAGRSIVTPRSVNENDCTAVESNR